MHAAIEDLLERLQLHSQPKQIAALASFVALLQRWNATYNLTALREPSAILSHHLADCLAAVRPLQQNCETGRVLDVGSGGGLPGVVFAVMLPQIEVSCVDAVGKKVAFVRQAAASLSLPNVHAVHSRVEAWQAEPFDLIASRAFSALPTLVSVTRHLLKPDGVWMAMKAKLPHDEIERIPREATVFHVEPLTVPGLPAERCLIWLRHNHLAGS